MCRSDEPRWANAGDAAHGQLVPAGPSQWTCDPPQVNQPRQPPVTHTRAPRRGSQPKVTLGTHSERLSCLTRAHSSIAGLARDVGQVRCSLPLRPRDGGTARACSGRAPLWVSVFWGRRAIDSIGRGQAQMNQNAFHFRVCAYPTPPKTETLDTLLSATRRGASTRSVDSYGTHDHDSQTKQYLETIPTTRFANCPHHPRPPMSRAALRSPVPPRGRRAAPRSAWRGRRS